MAFYDYDKFNKFPSPHTKGTFENPNEELKDYHALNLSHIFNPLTFLANSILLSFLDYD